MNSAGTAVSATELLHGMLTDAVEMASRGFASAQDIDTAMRLGAGHPRGPLQLLEELERGDLGPVRHNQGEPPKQPATDTDPWSGHVGVVGTGLMATGIAECAIRAGLLTTVLGRNGASCERSLTQLRASLDRAVKRGRMEPLEAEAALEKVTYISDISRLSACDLVIEAIAESVGAKQSVLRELDAALPAETWFTTNTSSYTVTELAEAVSDRRPFSALHFFNPAPAMKLIEIVEPGRHQSVIGASMALARKLGKTPVVCGDERGFIVNRLLIPYLNDAVRAVERGVDAVHVDDAVRDQLDHPMGPIALVDLIGLDVTVAALESMYATVGAERLAPARTLRELVSEGRLGKKVGHGFFQYPDRTATK